MGCRTFNSCQGFTFKLHSIDGGKFKKKTINFEHKFCVKVYFSTLSRKPTVLLLRQLMLQQHVMFMFSTTSHMLRGGETCSMVHRLSMHALTTPPIWYLFEIYVQECWWWLWPRTTKVLQYFTLHLGSSLSLAMFFSNQQARSITRGAAQKTATRPTGGTTFEKLKVLQLSVGHRQPRLLLLLL